MPSVGPRLAALFWAAIFRLMCDNELNERGEGVTIPRCGVPTPALLLSEFCRTPSSCRIHDD
jgi:hypothetical protein